MARLTPPAPGGKGVSGARAGRELVPSEGPVQGVSQTHFPQGAAVTLARFSRGRTGRSMPGRLPENAPDPWAGGVRNTQGQIA